MIQLSLTGKSATPVLTWEAANMKTNCNVGANLWCKDHLRTAVTFLLYRNLIKLGMFTKWYDSLFARLRHLDT